MGLSRLISGCLGSRKMMKKKSRRELESERREGGETGGDGGVGSGASGSEESSGASRSPRERGRKVGGARQEEGATSKGKEVATVVEEAPAEPTLEDTFAWIDEVAEELDPSGTDPEMDIAIRASLEEAARARAGIDLAFGFGEGSGFFGAESSSVPPSAPVAEPSSYTAMLHAPHSPEAAPIPDVEAPAAGLDAGLFSVPLGPAAGDIETRCNWSNVKKWWDVLSPAAKQRVRALGFAEFASLRFTGVNKAFVQALAERFKPETNTFAFPRAELSFTPLAFPALTGLPYGEI